MLSFGVKQPGIQAFDMSQATSFATHIHTFEGQISGSGGVPIPFP